MRNSKKLYIIIGIMLSALHLSCVGLQEQQDSSSASHKSAVTTRTINETTDVHAQWQKVEGAVVEAVSETFDKKVAELGGRVVETEIKHSSSAFSCPSTMHN